MKDSEVFRGKTLQQLLEDIYDNTQVKRSRIASLIDRMQEYLKNREDATVFAPIIKDYLDVMIKNDDHLIKIATIVQRVISADAYQKGGGDLNEILSDAEKERLLGEAVDELQSEMKALDTQLKDLDKKTLPTETETK
jgi:phosphoglycerate-specific signal transduction histidine kinase